ncbi:hypothetical protein FM103_04300 [Corynebacterium xerosis]|nr:hypothetical protein FM103_04300 [Corynebacterium xerosis]
MWLEDVDQRGGPIAAPRGTAGAEVPSRGLRRPTVASLPLSDVP